MPEISIDGRRLWYRVTSPSNAPDAPTLVLLHSTGSNSSIWLYQMRALRRHAQCIALDLPGHGKSDDDPACASLSGYADALRVTLDALEIDRCLLVGHAMGAAIAVHFATASPERVDALALIGAGVILPASDLVIEALKGPFDLWNHLMEDLLFSPSTPQRFVERSAAEGLQTNREILLRDFQAYLRDDLRDLPLEVLTMPTLIIAGRDDAMIPPPLSEVLAQQLSSARVEVIPEAGHMVQLEQHKRVNDLLSTFIHRRRT